MIRKSMGISRSLVAVAVLAAAIGCKGNSPKDPGQQLQSPTVPLAGIQISIGATRTRLQVGDDTTTSVITVQALRTADWTPLPNGTDAAFSATLGAIDSPSGGRAVTLDLVSGKASITLYPGTTDGTARVTVNIQGVSATLNIAIDPLGEPGPPAPTAATLSLLCTPSFFDEDGTGPFPTACTAKVTGSDGNPFSGASIYLRSDSGLGSFGTSGNPLGSTQQTNGIGEVYDTLTVSKADLLAFPGASFVISAHMGIVGGERTTSFTISILTGTPPAAATNLEFVVDPASDMFVLDDGSNPGPIDFVATVRDQFFGLFDGATVLFSSTLGTPSPTSATSGSGGGGTGTADTSLDLSASQVANSVSDQITVTAQVNTSGGVVSRNVIINIIRVDDPEPDDIFLTSDFNFVADDDASDAGAAETLNLTALVLDQFGAPFEDANVTFSSSLAGVTFAPQNGMTDSSGELDSTATIPGGNITAHPSNSFTITATVTTPDGPVADPITITIIRPPIAEFSFAYVPPATSAVTLVQFTDASGGGAPTSWAWDFDVVAGASTDASVQNPLHDFSTLPEACLGGGSCTVMLTVSNAAGMSSISKPVVVPTP